MHDGRSDVTRGSDADVKVTRVIDMRISLSGDSSARVDNL